MKKIFLQFILAMLILIPSFSYAAQTGQTIDVYFECASGNPDECPPYAEQSQELYEWLNDQGFSANAHKLYDGYSASGFQTAYDFLPSILKDTCKSLPVSVINHPTELDTIVCGFDKTKIISALQGNPAPTEPSNPGTEDPPTDPTEEPPIDPTDPVTGEPDPTPSPSGYDPKSVSYNIPSGISGSDLGIDTEGSDLLHMVAPLLVRIINLILMLAGIIAVFFIIINGYQMITSGGNQDAVQKSKNGITYAVIGLIITLVSSLILQTIQNLLGLV